MRNNPAQLSLFEPEKESTNRNFLWLFLADKEGPEVGDQCICYNFATFVNGEIRYTCGLWVTITNFIGDIAYCVIDGTSDILETHKNALQPNIYL